MNKNQKSKDQPKGVGFLIGLAIGFMFAVTTGNNGLFVVGIGIGAALEAK